MFCQKKEEEGTGQTCLFVTVPGTGGHLEGEGLLLGQVAILWGETSPLGPVAILWVGVGVFPGTDDHPGPVWQGVGWRPSAAGVMGRRDCLLLLSSVALQLPQGLV